MRGSSASRSHPGTANAAATAPASGTAPVEPGCPESNRVPIDLAFQRALETRFGSEAAAPQAYAIAHAMGHHVQRVLGLDREVARLVAEHPVSAYSVALQLELQADCLAGIWARMTKTRDLLDRTQVERALRQASEEGAAQLLNKDRDQAAPPETFTYAFRDAVSIGSAKALRLRQSRRLRHLPDRLGGCP